MLKTMLCGAAALGLMSQAAMANGIIINGVPHQGGGVVNVPYGHGSVNCCATEELSYNPLPVVEYQTAPSAVSYQAAPAAVSHQSAPVMSYEAAPAMSYEAAPVMSYEAAPIMTSAPIVSEEIVYIDQPVVSAPVAVAPYVAAPVVKAPAASNWSSRVYAGARGGWSGLKDTHFGLQGGTVANEYENSGYNVAAVVGWGAKVRNSIGYRLEAELGYQTADVESHSVGGTTFNDLAFGKTKTLYGFANAYLDVPLVSRLNGIVGGGVGAGKVKFSDHGINAPTVGTVMDDEDTAFGYHLDAGVSYDVSDQLALEAMYRYTSFVDVELTSRDGVTSETDLDSHNVVVGARYGF